MLTKETGKLKLAANGDREIVMTREFNAPRKMVFDAWTKPELLRRWLAGPTGWTMTVCEINLKVGDPIATNGRMKKAIRWEWEASIAKLSPTSYWLRRNSSTSRGIQGAP